MRLASAIGFASRSLECRGGRSTSPSLAPSWRSSSMDASGMDAQSTARRPSIMPNGGHPRSNATGSATRTPPGDSRRWTGRSSASGSTRTLRTSCRTSGPLFRRGAGASSTGSGREQDPRDAGDRPGQQFTDSLAPAAMRLVNGDGPMRHRAVDTTSRDYPHVTPAGSQRSSLIALTRNR